MKHNKPSANFKFNLESLYLVLKPEKSFEEIYYITLISMVYVFFEKFIKELINYKNEIVLKRFPKEFKELTKLEKLLYFSSKKEDILNLVKKLEEFSNKKQWEKVEENFLEINDIIVPSSKVQNLESTNFVFKQNIKDLNKQFDFEFGENIFDKIELEDFLQDKNPVKNFETKSYIDGKTFYSKYLSNPRTCSIHEAKIEENFQNEVINKNKIDIWKNSIINFVNEIEEYVNNIIVNA